MQRWEYKVLALRGSYTETLNEYGREGWELVSVASDVRGAEAPRTTGSSVPMPRALGRLEDAAARLKKLGGDDPAEPEPTTSTTLLWVLRRSLNDD